MKNFSAVLVLLLISSVSFAQSSINDYKYAMVQSQFSFQKYKDLYRLNSTTKAYFQKLGFEAYLDNEVFPDDFSSINCNKIYVQVDEEKAMLSTILTVTVKDCKNNILFTSPKGKSREKDFGTAYNEALREALKYFDNLHYKFNDKVALQNVTDVESVSTTEYTIQKDEKAIYIINKTTNVTLTLLKTSSPDSYIAKTTDKSGMAIKKGENWFFEYYDANNNLVSEKIEVKF